MKDDKKIWITATKPADPTQEAEAWETGRMSTGPSVLQSEVEREDGWGVVTAKRQFSM